MVVLVGLPGAGKTTFYRRILRDQGYIRRDVRSYISREAFILAVDEVVAQGLPVKPNTRICGVHVQVLQPTNKG